MTDNLPLAEHRSSPPRHGAGYAPPLAPGLDEWVRCAAALQTSLPAAPPDDLAAKRRRDRDVSDRLAARFTREPDPRARIDDIEIAGLRAIRLRPPRRAPGSTAERGDVAGSDDPAESAEPGLPTQVYLHGGGFVSGTPDELLNRSILAERVVACGIQIIALEYRLAPEHPYPAAVEDAVAVITELTDDAARWGADPDRLLLGGASAGGHIAAVALLRLRDAARAGGRRPRVRHALLEVPALDLTPDWDALASVAGAEARADAEGLVAAYLGGARPDELFSPARAADLGELPQTFVMVAECDPLRLGAELFHERALAARSPVTRFVGTGQAHGTPGATALSDSSRAWQAAAIAELTAALAASERPNGADPA